MISSRRQTQDKDQTPIITTSRFCPTFKVSQFRYERSNPLLKVRDQIKNYGLIVESLPDRHPFGRLAYTFRSPQVQGSCHLWSTVENKTGRPDSRRHDYLPRSSMSLRPLQRFGINDTIWPPRSLPRQDFNGSNWRFQSKNPDVRDHPCNLSPTLSRPFAFSTYPGFYTGTVWGRSRSRSRFNHALQPYTAPI